MRPRPRAHNRAALILTIALGLTGLGLGLLSRTQEAKNEPRLWPDPYSHFVCYGGERVDACPDPLVCLAQRPAGAQAPAAPDAPSITVAGVADPVGANPHTSTAPDTGSTGLILLAFVAGYQAGGGPPELLDHLLYEVIPCESGWRLDPGNPDYRGLGQFKPGTWASYSRPGADWRDPWEQGWAVADLTGDLLDRGVSPGSSAGWPSCWW